MHVHCLSVSNLNSCLCLRHRHRAIEYLLLFYLNVNIFFVFLILLPILFPIVENTRFSFHSFSLSPTCYICSEREPLYFIFFTIFCWSFLRLSPLKVSPLSLPVLFFVSSSKADVTSCLQKRQTFPQ